MFELNRNTNTITISVLWENYQLDKYNLNPPYQRKSIWSDEKKSFFIDSLFKNYPIPPIFLKQDIDGETGKTIYDVIDGKQRITAIIDFIENKLPITTENDPEEKNGIHGLYFEELNDKDFIKYKKKFWAYSLPIEYVEAEDSTLDDIFDRLNRNGEPLKGQELRKAKYHDSLLLELVEDLVLHDFWNQRLNVVDKSRMEDHEFISELLFMLLEKEPLQANQTTLDEQYQKYYNSIDSTSLKKEFLEITKFIEELNLPYEELKISGVSHLYGIWCFATYCLAKKIEPKKVQKRILDFYKDLRGKKVKDLDKYLNDYRISMSARTRDKSSRRKRMDALVGYMKL